MASRDQNIDNENSPLTEEELAFISNIQKHVFYKKGTLILSEGQMISKCFHVVKGCVRKYHLKDGEEKTTDFYIENDAISTSLGKTERVQSKFNLECVEDTNLTVLTVDQEEMLYDKFPRFQAMCRISAENRLEEYQEMLSNFISSSPKERYLNLLETRPDLLNRIPQYQIASYLGIKPETLSRIRKRITS